MASALTGVASAVAGITGDSESAKTLGFIALGLAGLTVVSRATVYWAARDPKTIPALKSFVESRKRPVTLSVSDVDQQVFPAPSAPPPTPSPPGTPKPSAPLPTPGPVGFEGFEFPVNKSRTISFLSKQLDRQPDIFRNAKYIRRHSL